MIRTENTFLYILILLIVCFFAFFINNQVIPADLMESRNLATAQEMVREKNYLTPTMNGELRLEKPPLPTWIAAGIEHIAPGSLVIQRCMAGLSATLMVFFLFLIVARLTRDRNLAMVSALILASCFNIVLAGRTVTWDIYCHSFMLGAIYFIILAFDKKGSQWFLFILAGIFMGLSFLSKGPVSFYALLLPFLISYGIIVRPRVSNKKTPLLFMILVCLAVSFWWPLYIMLYHQELAIAVAGKESSSWISHNVRPFWYYWQFPVEAGIWALFWLTSLIWFFSNKNQENRNIFTFSVIWALGALVLLSAIPEKKTRYLLPMLIPGSINIGFYIYHLAKKFPSKAEKASFRLNASLIGIISLILPIFLYMFFVEKGLVAFYLFAIICAVSWILSCIIFISIYNKRRIYGMNVFVCIILIMAMVESLCLIPIGHMFINEDRHSIRMLRNNGDVQGLPFFYNEDEPLRMELVYEANQTIRPINIYDDNLIKQELPFVFVSGLSIDSLFRNKNVSIHFIDTFDNNWRKPEHKRYNPDLVRQVAVIRPEKSSD